MYVYASTIRTSGVNICRIEGLVDRREIVSRVMLETIRYTRLYQYIFVTPVRIIHFDVDRRCDYLLSKLDPIIVKQCKMGITKP